MSTALDRCRGFRVENRDGPVGVVDEVLLGAEQAPAALVVRPGLFHKELVLVPAEDVVRVVQDERRVLVV